MKPSIISLSLLALAGCGQQPAQHARVKPMPVEIGTTYFVDADTGKTLFSFIGVTNTYQHGDEIHADGSPTFYVVQNKLESFKRLDGNSDYWKPSSLVIYKVKKVEDGKSAVVRK